MASTELIIFGTGAPLNALLTFYGLPIGGTGRERRVRFAAFIGLSAGAQAQII